MSETYPDYIDLTLRGLEEKHHLRRLITLPPGQVDFTSNDYLGLARKAVTQSAPDEAVWGSGGSRLLSGNDMAHEKLEQESARFFEGEAALLFSSGYLANLALMGTLPRRGDTLLLDELCHASLREGARLSLATSFTFRHNDPTDLQRLIRKARGAVFVVTEGLFSMDGDYPPLQDLVQICQQEGAYLILDEAHSTGIAGAAGAGLACEWNMQDKLLARVHTFGKAVGRMGAVIVSSHPVIQYLVNKARPFIFSTAMPAGMAALISDALRETAVMEAERTQLKILRRQFGELVSASSGWVLPAGDAPIIPLIIPGNEQVRRAADILQQAGLDVRPVLSPTVPAGSERLRIILHAYNTGEEVARLAATLNNLP
jgi:8-amino-7-oxononanoate synthase